MSHIKSIEMGWGEGSTYFDISKNANPYYKVDKILEQVEILGKGLYNDITTTVYCGYRNDELVFKIYAGSGVTVRYEEDTQEQSVT